MASHELVKSAGVTGLDLERTANRAYLISPNRIADPKTLIEEQVALLDKSISNGKRRAVMKARIPKELLEKNNLLMGIESALPIINGEKDDFIVTFGQNQRVLNEDKAQEQIQQRFQRNPVAKSALERVEAIKENRFVLSNRLSKDDAYDLMKLWWVFGWTWQGINDFIDLYKTKDAVDRNPKNLPVLVYSELNLDSHSTNVAASLGFKSPEVIINGVRVPQMLLENVFVLEKAKKLEELWLKLTNVKQKELLTDPDFYEDHLRNFTVMTLSNETISQLFNYYEIEHILAQYL